VTFMISQTWDRSRILHLQGLYPARCLRRAFSSVCDKNNVGAHLLGKLETHEILELIDLLRR
jgi:hypothetical protein